MSTSPVQSPPAYPDPSHHTEKYYRELQRKNIIRLVLTYLAPLVILSVYFALQYRQILIESRLAHLRAVAENQANTLDLFMQERVVNLSNLIDNPNLELPPSPATLSRLLETLRQNSDAFVDIGFFNKDGIQAGYAGPYPQLEKRNYSGETWFRELQKKPGDFVITDIYLGFREKLHFTIAVERIINGNYVVMRATLDPERIYNYIASQEGSGDVITSIVNTAGHFQLVTPKVGTALERSPIIPPKTPKINAEQARVDGTDAFYAYSWLRTCDWALIVQWDSETGRSSLAGIQINLIAFSAATILLILSIIVIRAKKIVREIKQADEDRAQLSDDLLHASKLAAVGELASGIAHEINNPLAIINEEVGLIKDKINPEFGMDLSLQDLKQPLDNIQTAVFRCRDITRKLLAFVRRAEMDLRSVNIHEVIDEVIQDFFERGLSVSNVEILREYGADPAEVVIDKNQMQQVFLNLIKNATDAIIGSGSITIMTSADTDRLNISVADTGKGMTQEQLEKIFLPFYTTKDVGKGTGLGLSISYGIVKSLGGEISVSSTLGRGSTFTITLPVARK